MYVNYKNNIIKLEVDVLKKIIEKLKNNLVFIILILMVFFGVTLYYRVFSKHSIINRDLYITSVVELRCKDLDSHKKIVVDSNESKVIKLTVKNNFNSSKKFYVWYKSDDDLLKIGSLNSSRFILSTDGNVIDKQKTLDIEIGIINTSVNSVTVEFGIVYGANNEKLDTPSDTKIITDTINVGKQREYVVGDKVNLLGNTKWYVIKESSDTDDYVTLLSDDIINILNQNTAMDNINNLVLIQNDEDNIKYYLENIYSKELEDKGINLGENGEIRLIHLNELLSFSNYNYKDYNYYGTSSPKWLRIKMPFWTMTPFSKDNYYYVYKGNIYFSKINTRAGIRPVIKVLKSNIK